MQGEESTVSFDVTTNKVTQETQILRMDTTESNERMMVVVVVVVVVDTVHLLVFFT